MCNYFLLVSRSCVIFPPKRFIICCCPERLRDFFVARVWMIFFIPRGCVIFVVPKDCVIFFVPRDCVIFLSWGVVWISLSREVVWFLFVPIGYVTWFFFVLRGCMIFFVPIGCVFFFPVTKGCGIFGPKRLRDSYGLIWTQLELIRAWFFYPERMCNFFSCLKKLREFPPREIASF